MSDTSDHEGKDSKRFLDGESDVLEGAGPVTVTERKGVCCTTLGCHNYTYDNDPYCIYCRREWDKLR